MENKPKKIEVKAGVVAWCTCGKSPNEFCVGAHVGTEQKPFVEKLERDTEFFICQCGLTKNYPFCDSSHREENND